MLIDLHNHTWPRSHDSVLDPADLAKRAREAGLDGICLTEHDSVWDPAEAQRLAEEQDFLIIPGVEISTDDGHILAFGVEQYVFGMHRISRLADHVLDCSEGLRPGVLGSSADLTHFWSPHPGGAHFLLCDGSVRFLSYSINHETFLALGSRNSDEVVGEF